MLQFRIGRRRSIISGHGEIDPAITHSSQARKPELGTTHATRSGCCYRVRKAGSTAATHKGNMCWVSGAAKMVRAPPESMLHTGMAAGFEGHRGGCTLFALSGDGWGKRDHPLAEPILTILPTAAASIPPRSPRGVHRGPNGFAPERSRETRPGSHRRWESWSSNLADIST